MTLLPLLRYLLAARNQHGLHSPFLYDLYTRTIRVNDRSNPDFAPIQRLRRELRNSRQVIDVTDFGTGSEQYARSVGSIARRSLKSDKFGRLLYRLTRRFEAKTVLDLGTSLGITTAYMAKAAHENGGRVITFEGCPQTAAVATETFVQLGYLNVEQVVGNLDETLAPILANLGHIDLVFFDANHRYDPTIQYFNCCLHHIHNDSVFIFDDIHWSPDMERAWETIKAHPSVTVTVDLFHVGLVFFRREQPKQNFILRF
jgi:predicted O-methyltransferase YrrM